MLQTRRNHYVPQFYLRYFCESDLLWVYQKGLQDPRAQTPVNTAVQKDLYTLTAPSGEKTDLVERALIGPSEAKAKPILDRLQSTETRVDEQDVATLGY